jgi:hypothetical protein
LRATEGKEANQRMEQFWKRKDIQIERNITAINNKAIGGMNQMLINLRQEKEISANSSNRCGYSKRT